MVITGTYDYYIPLANSLIIVVRIPGARLVQITDAGDAVLTQYSDNVNGILQTLVDKLIILCSKKMGTKELFRLIFGALLIIIITIDFLFGLKRISQSLIFIKLKNKKSFGWSFLLSVYSSFRV